MIQPLQQAVLLVCVCSVLVSSQNTTPPVTAQNTTTQDPDYCEDVVIGFLPMKSTEYEAWPLEEIKKASPMWWKYLPDDNKVRVNMYGNCYTGVLINITYPREEWDLLDVHNPTTLLQLSNIDALVGHHNLAMERYAKKHQLPYILSLPPNILLENRLRHENSSERVVFSAWPSWYDFFETSSRALRLKRMFAGIHHETNLGRVFILTEGPDHDYLASELAKVLMEGNAANAVYTSYFHSTLNSKRMRIEALLTTFSAMNKFDPTIVVFFYRSENSLAGFFKAFPYMRTAYESLTKAEWYIWDMRTDFNGILSNLLNQRAHTIAKSLRLRSIGLFNNKPYGLDCDHIISDISEIVGANDAATMAILNACPIPARSFSRQALLDYMRETHIFLAGVEKRQSWMNILSGWSFDEGFRVFPAIYIGVVIPDVGQRDARPDSGATTFSRRTDTAPRIIIKNCRPKQEIFQTKYYNKYTKMVHTWYKPLETASNIEEITEEDQRIVIVMEEPFGFLRKKGKEEEHDGIVVMMVKEAFYRMSLKLGRVLKYSIYHTASNQYGMYNTSSKTWSGALGQLQNESAVMAIGMFSKTKDRLRDFDFGPTWEYVGVTYLYQKHLLPAGFFSFMRPFELSIWWGLLGVMLLSCIFIFILDRWNPFLDKVEREKRFYLNESMWYSFGTITQAGGEFAPSMYPTRVYSVFYWFFALVVGACYTGNLASFLAETVKAAPRGPLSEIPYIKNTRWGTLQGSYMDHLIRHNKTRENYIRLAKGLQYVKDYKEGTERAMEGNFAFIGTNLLLQYYTAKDPECNLALSPFYQAFTEIAFPMHKNWILKDDFNEAMYSMRHDGKIRDYLQKWISKTTCSRAEEEDEHIQLHFANFSGLYILLAVFIFISYILLFIKLGALKLKKRLEKMRRKNTKDGPHHDGEIEIPMVEHKDNQEDDVDESGTNII